MYVGFFHPSSRWPFPAVASGPDPAAVRPPMVLAGMHVGAVEAVGAFLERLPADALALVDREWPTRHGVRTISLGTDQWGRVAAIKRAFEALRAGGFVFLVINGSGNSRVRAMLYDQEVSWSRGGFDLCRLTGAPMVPVMTRWRGRKVEIETGAPILPGDAQTMAASLAHWLEQYLSDKPRERVELLGVPS